MAITTETLYDLCPDLDIPYVSTGHLRTALTHADGVVVVFADGIVTCGRWQSVAHTYPQAMLAAWNRESIETLLAEYDSIHAVRDIIDEQLALAWLSR